MDILAYFQRPRLQGTLGMLIVSLISVSCAYRFTGKYTVPPAGIKTIAIESIYNTSREPVHHELLWTALQEEIAKDGVLRVTDRKKADALLRIHLNSGDTVTGGPLDFVGKNANDRNKDFDPYNLSSPPNPNEFRKLGKAREIRDSYHYKARINVELIHLRTKEMLFKSSYLLSTNNFSARQSGTSVANANLRFSENKDYALQYASQKVSQNIIQDILVR